MAKERRTKKEIVYLELRNSIIKGGIRPGSRLIISKLAKEFNMSEIPVREALQRLSQEGYLLSNPHSGMTVSSLSREDILQIFEIRINLEGLAARKSVKYLSNAHIETLQEMIEDSNEFIRNQDLEGYWEFNRSFHNYIYQLANNNRLFTMIDELCEYSKRYPTYYTDIKEIEDSIEEHKVILSALYDRDADLVEKLIKEHTRKSYNHIINRIKQLEKEKIL